jgi:hypothetical protein
VLPMCPVRSVTYASGRSSPQSGRKSPPLQKTPRDGAPALLRCAAQCYYARSAGIEREKLQRKGRPPAPNRRSSRRVLEAKPEGRYVPACERPRPFRRTAYRVSLSQQLGVSCRPAGRKGPGSNGKNGGSNLERGHFQNRIISAVT